MSPSFALRHFETLDDYRACVGLQEEIWGAGFSERVPTAILKVTQSLGGVAAGAFDPQGSLEGFVFGMTGVDPTGEVVHWSDMLAVRPRAAGSGLATRLKALQRTAVMEVGVRRMLWTFDPLRARNAHLNLNKLGAVVREYRRDMYGDTDSVLHRGIGTDRFVALWMLDSERVAGCLARALGSPVHVPAGGSILHGPVAPSPGNAAADTWALGSAGTSGFPRPTNARLGLEEDAVRVAIPADIGAIMERDVGLAIAWREATREVLVHYLGRGYEVRHLSREEGAGPFYVLSRIDSQPRDTLERP